MSILTIDHISKYYNLDGTNQERALNDVTLGIAPGKALARALPDERLCSYANNYIQTAKCCQ